MNTEDSQEDGEEVDEQALQEKPDVDVGERVGFLERSESLPTEMASNYGNIYHILFFLLLLE